ncbi:sensor histidine kinase [Clostridium uliginosum]|uniref:histidine kinase n=1 Tax=Clostridium uliginosum TaxID=119641 RepID=A0A1I1S2P2_9CLOT|nr:HAMP domain-containing sensor histidine kinase [Clostridium uliginosum]SFD38043.1 Signal transduction histidine kinase [Clostridium uliginosum]
MNMSKQNTIINIINDSRKVGNIAIEWVVLFIGVTLYCAFTKEYKLYITLDTAIYISITSGVIYISMVKINAYKNYFLEYLGLESIFISIVTSVSLLILNYNWNEVGVYYLVFLSSMLYCFEVLIISLGFYFSNKRTKVKKGILIYTLISISILFFIMPKNYLWISTKINFFTLRILLNNLLAILLTAFMISNLLKSKSILSEFDNIKIYLYIFLRLCSYISLIFIIKGFKEFIIISGVLKLSAFYFLYRCIVNEILSQSFKTMKKKLEEANKIKIELSTTISKKNRILNETNIMIEKSQSKYNELIDLIYDGVFLFSLNCLEYINKSALKLLGDVNKEDLLGIEMEDFIAKYFNFKLEKVKLQVNHITDVKMKCNNLIVDLFVVYIDSSTKLLYIHDVTEIKKSERMRNKLETYLREEELKNQFFSNVSHELRTPINLIFSAMQLNEISLQKENFNNIKKNNKIIKQNSLRLIRTINNFIDTNKVSEGYLKPDFKIYNIVEVVENISIACNKYINKAEINLIFDAQEEEIYVKCDKDMIERIILNILSNSVKYGKKGGEIKVNIIIKEKNVVVITVKNNGHRIEEKTIPYVFDKFTKLNKSLNRLREGSGLGLFLTKALVELQGGNISLTSDENGNTFIINLSITNQKNNINAQYDLEMNNIEEKVDVEFSDIYIE